MTRFMCSPAMAANCLPTAVEPGERDLTYRLVRDQILGNFRRNAVHQIDHTIGQAGIDESGEKVRHSWQESLPGLSK